MPIATLTSRQRDVLTLSALGNTNKEIADILGIAKSTVKIHSFRACHRLDCRTRTQAVYRAVGLGLIEMEKGP